MKMNNLREECSDCEHLNKLTDSKFDYECELGSDLFLLKEKRMFDGTVLDIVFSNECMKKF